MTSLRAVSHFPYDFELTTETGQVSGVACRDEMLSMAFSLVTDEATPLLELELSPLKTSGGATLDADLHVVHRWLQSGVGVFQTNPIRVGELLLKDDETVFKDGYRRRCASIHLHRSATRYAPPKVRLTGNVNVGLEPLNARQFWISVPVSARARPAVYRGTIKVRHGRKITLEIDVSVEVLPITLMEPKQDLMLWYRGTLNCHHPQHYVSPRAFEAQLKDIYAHGFRSISLWETDPALLQKAVDIAQRAGFRNFVVLDGHNRQLWSQVNFGRLTPIAYVSDELDGNGIEGMEAHMARFQSARAAGASTMASVVLWNTRERLGQADGVEPDVVSVYAPTNVGRLLVRRHSGGRSSSGRTWYYWQAHMEKPLVHRLLAGLFLWKTGADGISPYCYQHLPGMPYSPFDDFDPWEPTSHQSIDSRPFRDHMATYPAKKGVIPTVQWKGMADGLTDLRYLVTLDHHLDRASQSTVPAVREKAAKLRAGVTAIADRIPWLGLDILSATNPVPAPGVAKELRDLRVNILEALRELAAGED